MNAQDVFNIAYAGMRAQEFRQATRDGRGCYLADNGDRCAAGIVLHHFAPDVNWDGLGDIDELIEKNLLPEPLQHWHISDMLAYLQEIHDSCNSGECMRVNLEGFIIEHNGYVPEAT